ncbi:DUF7673 family protein, partial [Sphingomonas hankookensis]|uniref:DUF7673 family protein n=1 Tax=Sphingomonas hankookensis TaxID=563996 RepID=UPI003F7B2148
MAWWDGGEWGHFPVLHLCNCDAVISEDMLIVMAHLAAEPTVYADAWGYRDAMAALVDMAARMTPLRTAIDIMTGEPIDRDTRRARLLAARRKRSGASPAWHPLRPLGRRERSSARSGAGAAASSPIDPENRAPLPAERASGALPIFGDRAELLHGDLRPFAFLRMN